MAVTLIGLIYYADDPDKKVFRKVIPELDDSELDEPPTDPGGKVYRDVNGDPYTWLTLGTDPS